MLYVHNITVDIYIYIHIYTYIYIYIYCLAFGRLARPRVWFGHARVRSRAQ